MNACPALDIETGGLAQALRAIDCRTGEGTQIAFGRLFGDHGALIPALTILLTLYVAIFAIGLLTGRTRLGIGSLTPRMLTLGMVLTFATSWLAYQNVIWMLAVGAPDQLASVIAGTHGSATAAFADKLDVVFQAIADSTHQQNAQNAVAAANATGNGASSTGISILSPQGMMWISGLMLLVGTVGVLVTAKVALAALLALGPVFIVLAIFPATRGLFEGWLKAVVSSALTPLFTVLIGGAAISLITPLIRDALMDSTEVASKSATALFLAACVYTALMIMVARVASGLVAGWRIPFLQAEGATPAAASQSPATILPPVLPDTNGGARPTSERVRGMLAALPPSESSTSTPGTAPSRTQTVVMGMAPATALPAPRADRRLDGVGSRFRARPETPVKARLS
ncbi:type IV secretion system protein [Sphingomonas oryzagri]|uniref:Type IV secretion system protein n=1 Tax=Sphingomonas oryzagri TaxID=3042314 RepID=A0ABT6MZ64_9SPHN|nr:type IV secretion system protein [Sphingomonas oryzagri]MDH7637788.1 type IV secretion system protein [Sphingomonas oryzagri]